MCRVNLIGNLLRCVRWSLFLSLLLFSQPGISSASATQDQTYQVTETELTELQNSLTRLKEINVALRQELGLQRNRAVDLQTQLTVAQQQLNEAKTRQTALQAELTSLKNLSMKQETLLTEANESFQKYEREEKARRLRIKAQRNTWAAAAGLLAIGLAVK